MREGDRMVVVDPYGAEFEGRIECVDGGRARVVVSEGLPPRVATPRVTLFQCVGKGRKMDQVVRQSTELGVAAVVPVVSERTVVRLAGEKALERRARWQRIAEEAAKQSGRGDVPEIGEPLALAAAAAELASLPGAIALWEGPAGSDIGRAIDRLGVGPGDRVGVLVGPEGGLSDKEAAELDRAGIALVSLGGQVLRSETAGIVGLALTLHALGGLAPEGSADGEDAHDDR
jgi:16S rRNA (uracil1498-N3)-methyltransferase